MELSKCRKFLKDNNYVHCSVCGNYRNMNSFAHRKSKDHQKKLAAKLRKISFHLSQKKKKQVIIHDKGWPEKDLNHFCHFCAKSITDHFLEGEFIVEDLGSMYHYTDLHHAESVKEFLKRNFSKKKAELYCIQQTELDSFLKKVVEAKEKYLKKMDLLNDMILKQIKCSEKEREKLVSEELQVQQSSNYIEQNPIQNSAVDRENIKLQSKLLSKNKSEAKVPPWLEDSPDNCTAIPSTSVSSSAPIIGPTMDTLLKHVANEKKKGLPPNRVGANYKHAIKGSSKWLPAFHGIWDRRRRKEFRGQAKQRKSKI